MLTLSRLVVASLCCGLVVSGCSEGDIDSSSTPVVEVFTGSVDDFYVVPDPLPFAEPGALIRIQEVASDSQSTTLRIMYHSRDTQDRDRAVTGILTYPNASPPVDGWPVVSLANGTVGLASPCALSRLGRPAPRFGVNGVGVVTDYIGLGPIGELHPYLSRLSEGHSVIDAVRAARNLPEAGAGTRWLAIGHSQGGHGSLSAHELAAQYAPELELLGTVTLAPAALFDRTYGGIDPIVAHVVGVMGFYGALNEYPEIHEEDYVSPEGMLAAQAIQTQCLDDITTAVLTVPADEFYTHHPLETEPARSIILANDVGGVSVASPLLLVGGGADTIVVIERVHDLLDKLCAAGQVTQYIEYPAADHGNEYAYANDAIEAWFADRLTGVPAVDSCDQ